MQLRMLRSKRLSALGKARPFAKYGTVRQRTAMDEERSITTFTKG
jgi:hypothetical protein